MADRERESALALQIGGNYEPSEIWLQGKVQRLQYKVRDAAHDLIYNHVYMLKPFHIRRFRGGVKIRPASQPRIVVSSLQGNANRNGQKDGKDQTWQRTVGPHRPHTVAVMARNKGRSKSANGNCELVTSDDNLEATKRSKTPSLCGCASRQPLALPEVEALPDANLTLAKPQSPLNDVSDLLFGIQSVEITMKPHLTD